MSNRNVEEVADEELHDLLSRLYFTLRQNDDLLIAKARTMAEAEKILDLVQEARYYYRKSRNLVLERHSEEIKSLVTAFNAANESVDEALADLKQEAKTVGVVCTIVAAALEKARGLFSRAEEPTEDDTASAA